MNKVAITGHTQGIGLAIADTFRARGDEVVGFSITNGYILPKAMDRVVEESKECDIFINNAHTGFLQVDLLYRMFNTWRGQDKRIVTIGSRAGTYPQGRIDYYANTKKAIDVACAQLNSHPDHRPRVINVKPGYVNTNSVAKCTEPKLDPQVIADTIMWIIDQPPLVHINEVSLMHMQYG